MFKGEPGTRKSTQALSYPKPLYYFDTDQKMDALQLPMRAWGIKPSEVHFDSYVDYSSIRSKLESLQRTCPYKTIVVDSITSAADVINRQTIKAKSGTTTTSGQEKGMKIGGISVNSIEDYKAEASAFQEIIALTKDIHNYHKVNIILIAHVIGERKMEGNSNTHFARIIVTGGKIISAKIPAYCSEIYHFNVENVGQGGRYGLKTQHTGDDFARTSLPLESTISFGEEPLYDKYIKPAIDKLKIR
jgi:hypothetical protein